MRTIGLYLYASVKGGVGKSTLAVLAAKLLAAHGRRPVVLDADVLGSSLADGLELCAPVVPERAGTPDYGAEPSGHWHDLAATRKLRAERKNWWKEQDPSETVVVYAPIVSLAPPFVNDVWHYPDANEGRMCRVDAMLWRHTTDDHVRYLPSSPLREDAMRMASFVSGEPPHFTWAYRLAWLIDALVKHDQAMTDVIIDLPPGTWGSAHETLVLAKGFGSSLPGAFPQWHDRVQWRVVPTIVTTPDRNDRLLAMEYWLMARMKIPALQVAVNRTFESEVKTRSAIRSDLPEPLRAMGLEDEVSFVPNLQSTLGRLFVQGDLRIDQDHRELVSVLRLDTEN